MARTTPQSVMCLHFVQGPEMTHSYSINILSLQLTLLIEKILLFETTVFDECPKLYNPNHDIQINNLNVKSNSTVHNERPFFFSKLQYGKIY